MISRSTRRFLALSVTVALALRLAACGGDDNQITSVTPPPDAAGPYSLQWTLQVLRKSDGFQKAFTCYGQMTLVQGAAVSVAPLSGFAVVSSGCAPESYDLNGSISSGGAIEFDTNGPKPPEGPCPGGKNVHFTGQLTTSGSRNVVSARGVTTVTCPQYGEHEFTYLVNAVK